MIGNPCLVAAHALPAARRGLCAMPKTQHGLVCHLPDLSMPCWLWLCLWLLVQVARQEGIFLAELLKAHPLAPEGDLPQDATPFSYSHKGSAAYVGAGKSNIAPLVLCCAVECMCSAVPLLCRSFVATMSAWRRLPPPPACHNFTPASARPADHAVLDIPNFGLLLGTAAGVVWKGFETFSQISFRNQVRGICC